MRPLGIRDTTIDDQGTDWLAGESSAGASLLCYYRACMVAGRLDQRLKNREGGFVCVG
jgi:hypothetical protein